MATPEGVRYGDLVREHGFSSPEALAVGLSSFGNGDYGETVEALRAGVPSRYAGSRATADLWYAANRGMQPSEWAEQVSRLKQATAAGQSHAFAGMARSGTPDPHAMAAVRGRMEAARIGGLASLERANLAFQRQAREKWDQYLQQRRQNIFSNIMSVIGLGAGIAHAFGGGSAAAPVLGGLPSASSVATPSLDLGLDPY